MATQDYNKFFITPFWTDSFKELDYINETFNDAVKLAEWKEIGYDTTRVTGMLCDMRSPQPSWNDRFIQKFEKYKWQDIGTSYYRMDPGTVLPTHSDLYKKYVEVFKLNGQEHSIRRAIVFLEDWASGHYLEIAGDVITKWTAGTVIEWAHDTPHLAANIGPTPRYTLQVTGHL